MKLIAWLAGRGDTARGREMLDDARELFEERRLARGRAYAALRWSWDLVALLLRRGGTSRRARASAMTRLSCDAVQAWRAVRGRPLVSVTSVGALALGLALAMLAFTLVDAIMLRPLRFPRADELLLVYTEYRPESGYDFPRFAASPPEIADYASQNTTVDVAAFEVVGVTLADEAGSAERVPAVRAASGVFRILETPPLLGRTLTPADDAPGAPCAAVLGYGLWQQRLSGEPNVIGTRLRVDGRACAVVGVMPVDFAFPTEATRLWLPLPFAPDPNARGSHGLMAIGRLRPGVSLARAREELAILMSRWAGEMPHHAGHGIVIAPLRDEVVLRVEQQLVVLGSATGLVLLAIAANLSGLLLAHGEARRGEIAVRSALGASRFALVRQMLLEGWMLAALGGLAGGFVAWSGLGPILDSYPGTLPRMGEVHVGLRTIAAGALAALAIGTGISLVPAVKLTASESQAGVLGSRSGTAPRLRMLRTLVGAELAVGVAVIVGALLLAQSFVRLQRTPLGFETDGVTTAVVALPEGPGRGPGYTTELYARVVSALAVQPGVAAAGAISSPPLAATPPPDDFSIEGRPVAPPGEPTFNAGYVMVTPGALEALGVGLVRGRMIEARDRAAAPPVAVVNETSARMYWPGDDPLGGRIRYAEGIEDGEVFWGPWITIVGIAGDIRSVSPAEAPRPAVYVAHAQLPRRAYDGRTMAIVVRADASVDVATALRRAVRAADAEASVSAIQSMDRLAAAAVAQPRFMGWIMGLFAAIALFVVALGAYGVVAFGVQRRTKEIGLRMALGASRARIVRLIGGETLSITIGGLLVGLGAAAALAWSTRSLLFEVDPFDLPVYAAVCLVLALAIAIATGVPAGRATRIDPLAALRME